MSGSIIMVSLLLLVLLPIRWFQRNGFSERGRHPGGIDNRNRRIVTRNGVFQVGYDVGDIIRTRATVGLASCYSGSNDDWARLH